MFLADGGAILGSVNLYKIDNEKQQMFFQELARKMDNLDTIFLERQDEHQELVTYGCTLYMSRPDDNKELSWNWVLQEFNQQPIEIPVMPKCVIVIESEDDKTYAVTFGHAYFLVDKFCDRDFGFNFARKLSYDEIKTTTLTTPNSRRNKTVNTYINYSELEFDSGESFAKLKAKLKLPEDFTLYKASIEVGSSIRFSTVEESMERLIDLILHVEYTLTHEEDKYNIPVFSKVKDFERLAQLEANLIAAIHENPSQINISELDIIGVTEIFNHNDSEFILSYRGKKKSISLLSNEEIQLFCEENDWNYSESLLDITVISQYNGSPVVTKRVKDLIDYTDDQERCLLSKGVWYQYNEDYLSYLRDSIAEIAVEYHPEFDFTSVLHDQFVDSKYEQEKDDHKYAGKSPAEIKNSLKKKYYAERAFNLLREETNGFVNYDRDEVRVGGSRVEVMDLYKEGMMCAVKIGNASSKLCYAVDQSLTALKLYKKHQLPRMPEVSTIVLWFVLERQDHIEDENGCPQLEELDMLMLKNRLDQWKKEVRLQGLKPLIYINYRTN
jgi:uncharacterized protein (TIGR04141 family)